MEETKAIIVVDDESEIRRSVVEALEVLGHLALGCASAFEALELLEHTPVKLLISDWMMPRMNGVDFVREIRRGKFSDTPFLLMSGAVSRAVLEDALKTDVDGILLKPFNLQTLTAKVEETMQARARKISSVVKP